MATAFNTNRFLIHYDVDGAVLQTNFSIASTFKQKTFKQALIFNQISLYKIFSKIVFEIFSCKCNFLKTKISVTILK